MTETLAEKTCTPCRGGILNQLERQLRSYLEH
jgi:hypothetical protein